MPIEKVSPSQGLNARRYPWDTWFAKKRFVLVRGKDFNGRTDTMLQQIRNKAAKTRYNKKLQITVSEDGEAIAVNVLGPKTERKVR